MTKEQKEFIEQHIDLIEDHEWHKLFKKAEKFDVPLAIGDILYMSGVNFMDELTEIPFPAFFESKILTEIIIPENINSLSDYSFQGCSKLKHIDLPETLVEIGRCAFRDCTQLSEINIPDNVTTIEHSAFYNCTSLKEIKIPDSVTKIGTNAFQKCKNLKTAALPKFLSTIDDFVFSYSGLTSLTIPQSIDSIHKGAFLGCSNLTDMMFEGTTEEWSRINISPGVFTEVPAQTIKCINGVTNLR